MGDGDDFARAVAFQEAIEDREARRIEPFRWGVAIFDDRYPKRHDSNFLRVTRSLAGVTPTELAAEADRLHAAAGQEYRQVRLRDESDGARLAAGFGELGWRVERLLVMPRRRPPDRPVDTTDVEEVGWPAIRWFVEETIRREPWAASEDLVRMLADHRRTLETGAGARRFVARVGRRIASACDLYSDGRTAQIEYVDTLEEFRNRGLARAVVTRATEEASAAGHDLVFIVALADDWPKELYAKLGFDPIGSTFTFGLPQL